MFIVELLVKHKDKLAVYNHTLATILVEYASAVKLLLFNEFELKSLNNFQGNFNFTPWLVTCEVNAFFVYVSVCHSANKMRYKSWDRCKWSYLVCSRIDNSTSSMLLPKKLYKICCFLHYSLRLIWSLWQILSL